MVLEKVFKPNQRKVVLLPQHLLQVKCFCEVIKNFKIYNVVCVCYCILLIYFRLMKQPSWCEHKLVKIA